MIIASDIDNTQYACERPELDAPSIDLKSIFEEFRQQGHILIHNTARHYPWIADGCAPEHAERFVNPIIAEADFVIHSSGTAIHHTASDQGDLEWNNKINTVTSRQEIHWLREVLSGIGLALHGESNHTPFKTSFVSKPEDKEMYARRVKKIIQERFDNAFEFSTWNATDIEITPRGFNKKTALDFLLTKQRLFDTKVVVAGDSYNDLVVLDDPRRLQIVTGNAPQQIKNQISAKHPQAFIASAEQPVATGVIAGLRHFGLL